MTLRIGASKGQMMVDALMLVLVLVIIVSTMHVFLGEQAMRTQSLRYQATQHQSTLVSVLEKHVETKGMDGRVVDLLAFHACNGCPSNKSIDYCPELEQAINDTLLEINQGQKHFIFATSTMVVYDKQDKVCLDSVPVARYKLPAACGETEIIYGTWFNWFEPPEVC